MVTWVKEWVSEWCERACRDNLSEMFVHLKFQLNRLSVMHDKRIFISHRKLTIFDSFPVSLYFHSCHYAHTERHTITLLAIQSNNNVQLHEKYPTANRLCLFPRESEWVGVCVSNVKTHLKRVKKRKTVVAKIWKWLRTKSFKRKPRIKKDSN